METWSTAETRDLVKIRFGKDQLDLVGPSLNSISERRAFAQYHFLEIQSVISKFKTDYLLSNPHTFLLYFKDENYREAFEKLMLETGAHAVAAVQSLHAIRDILAHVVYYGLGINLQEKRIKKRLITYGTVLKLASENTLYHLISIELSGLSGPDFKHISGLANKSKHQNIVRPLLSEDLTGNRAQRHELQFSEFQHDGKYYPKASLELLLSNVYLSTSKAVVSVGNSLNMYLRNSN